VAAAIKLIPLGQTAGQRSLLALANEIPEIVARALQLTDDEIGQLSPAFAIACALHETQYTRLFRS
jgi:urease accessory protein